MVGCATHVLRHDRYSIRSRPFNRERRRRILLIVPATLRKQWVEELQQKFGLQARIIDQRTQRFDQSDAILMVIHPFLTDAVRGATLRVQVSVRG